MPVTAQTGEDPSGPKPVADLTVYMTGYRYTGSNDQDGIARVSWDKVEAACGVSREEILRYLQVKEISDQSVLPKDHIRVTEEELILMPAKAGSVTAVFTVRDESFAVKLSVWQPVMSTAALMFVKQKRTLSVTGAPAGSRVSYTTSNKRIATVNSYGKVTAKAAGNAVIYATVGTVRLGCVVSVTTRKKVRAINRATRIVKSSRYSMPRRMRKGYYDCSSLVWRAYRPERYYFGNKKYAPTAALEARYLARRKKLLGNISYNRIQSMRYRAGDVIFLTGARNGRYKGIYHVEMFWGYRYLGMTDAGRPAVTSLWVNRSEGRYDMGVAGVMGRP